MHEILANSENPIIFYIYLPRMGAERARKSRVSKNIYMKFLEIGEAKTGAHSRAASYEIPKHGMMKIWNSTIPQMLMARDGR